MRKLLSITTALLSLSASAQDSARVRSLDEIVITATRVPRQLLRSPVTVEKAGENFFNASAAPSFFDALQNLKGVQMITPSLGFRVINTRGFTNTTNVRFSQLVDGMDIQSPHIGAPVGNTRPHRPRY